MLPSNVVKTNLKKRIVPKLLILEKDFGRIRRPVLVTTKKFNSEFQIGDAVSQAKIYESQYADELVVLNIDSSSIVENETKLRLIEKLASETFMPLAVGGGVKKIEDFSILLNSGADKVCINTAAIETPELIAKAADQFGSQCIVVSIDFRMSPDGSAKVYYKRGKKYANKNLLEWARKVEDSGAGEIILTDIDRDGTGTGLNTKVCSQLTKLLSIPVILSGGCGLASHFVDGFETGGAEAIAAGTFFCFRDQNPIQTRAHIKNAGINIRVGN